MGKTIPVKNDTRANFILKWERIGAEGYHLYEVTFKDYQKAEKLFQKLMPRIEKEALRGDK